MKVNTYGINGLTEWYGDLKSGSISVKVSFVGGTASPSGAQPAYFVTKDPITQFVIENSKEFKSGFIHLEMSQEIPGNHPRMAIPTTTVPTAPIQTQARSVAHPESRQETVPGLPSGVEATNGNSTIPADEPAIGGTEEGAESGEGVQTVEVACKADAVEWLKERYPDKGYNGNTLRAAAAFEAACNEARVKFVIND